MKNSILLSVIIPAYNASNTIIRAIKTVAEHKSNNVVEIIIVNDGSEDDTLNKCRSFIEKFEGENVVFRLVDQKNAGHGSAINYGIKNARGRYLRVLDADDYFETEGFSDYLDYLMERSEDLIITNYKEVSKAGDGSHKKVFWLKGNKGFNEMKYEDVIISSSPVLLPFATVKTEVLRKSNYRIDEKCYYDDQEYDFLIILLCEMVAYYDKTVYCYVIGSTQQSISEKSLVKNIKDHEKVVKWLVENYYMCDFSHNKKAFVFKKILVPLCYQQYHIALRLKKARLDFLSFDSFLKKYKELYNHNGVAGERIKVHRITKGLFV